jgi:hypothetical protein
VDIYWNTLGFYIGVPGQWNLQGTVATGADPDATRGVCESLPTGGGIT